MRAAFFVEMSEELHTVWWEDGAVCLIDQRRLPHEQITVRGFPYGIVRVR